MSTDVTPPRPVNAAVVVRFDDGSVIAAALGRVRNLAKNKFAVATTVGYCAGLKLED